MVRWGFNKDNREHRYVEERLSAYVDGEVSSRERRRIESHLAGCEACRAELRALRWTVDLLRQTPPVKAPRRFVVREADVAKAPARARAPLQVTQWATAVVALLFVLVVGVDLLAGRGLPRAATVPVARGEREMLTVTQVVEEQTDQVARAMPGETPPPMPTLEARIEAEAAPVEAAAEAEQPETTGAPMALKGQGLDATGTVTVTEEAGAMLAAPGPSPTPAGVGGGGTPPPEAPAPEVDLQPESQAPEPKLTERALPTPSQEVERYGLRRFVLRQVLLWRVAEVTLGLVLLGLLIAVVWMRGRR
jgi:hypothetical protein